VRLEEVELWGMKGNEHDLLEESVSIRQEELVGALLVQSR
jgi:hypothetical protein